MDPDQDSRDPGGVQPVPGHAAPAPPVAGLIRSRDWSASPLGDPAGWPPSLRAAVGLILPAASQIVLFWGPDYVALYNDAYAPTIGDKHPRALGRPAREHWAELWDDLEPLLARVRDRGETVHARDREFRIERHGYPETVWFDISYSPVPDETGAVGGVLCIVGETTERVLAERRLRARESAFHDIADSIDQMIWSTRPDGYHDYYNRRWYEYTGVPDGSTDGEAWNGMFHPDDQERAWSVWRHSLATGEPYQIEYRLRHRSGEYRWVLGRAQPVRGDDGLITRWYGTCTDIHDLKLAEAALAESEARFRNMADHAPVMMWVTEADGLCSWLNRGWYEFTGQAEAEAAGYGWLDATHPDDRAGAEAAFRAANAAREPFRIEYRLRRRDGAWRWCIDAAAPRFAADGAFLGFVGSVIDIEDRRAAEDALRASEDRLRLATQAAAIGTWDYEPVGGALRWDARCKALFGLPADAEVDYDVFLAGLHPDDRAATDAAVQQALADGVRYDVEYRTIGVTDGVERWIAASGQAFFEHGRAVRFVGTVIDISDRKRDEAAIAASQAALREESQALEILNRTAARVAAELDLETLVQTVVDAGVGLTGAGFGAFFYNVADPDGGRYTLYALSGVGRAAFDGFPMPRNTAVFGPTFAGAGVVRSDDILEDPRYGLSEPWRGMPPGHLPVRAYLAVPVVSRSGEVIGGLFFGHAEPAMFDERAERLVAGLAAQAAVAIDNARLFQDAQRLNQTLETRVAEEIARHRDTEARLRQAQKMETVGQLTGGVAHDFNNLLQIVTGNLDILLRNLPGDAPRLKRSAENAMRGAQRAATLTQRLLAFSRRQPLAPRAIDPNRLVTGMSELLHRTLGETIEIETVLASGLWRIEADPNQLENAILNLALNARDAMDGGGKLTIETANTHLDRAYAAHNVEVVAGQYVAICVSDTGVGMDADTVARAFEPFFTTKEVGRGTGLGLSMIYGFVKQSGGHVKIYSEPGEGTTVRLYLPRLVGGDEESEEEAEAVVPEGTRDETILVCEDDDDVRAYSVEVLRELGYRVLEAHDGPSALRLLERQEGRVDLLFSDVVLPSGMTGADLARRARALRPGLRVLYTTGYARDAIVHHGRLDPGVELITKPFSYSDLAARVRDLLDAEPPGD